MLAGETDGSHSSNRGSSLREIQMRPVVTSAAVPSCSAAVGNFHSAIDNVDMKTVLGELGRPEQPSPQTISRS
jgi:hypothetical protein